MNQKARKGRQMRTKAAARSAWRQILLVCPECRLAVHVAREPEQDPPQAVTCRLLCPECCRGDFSSQAYYDAQDREL